jgi:hypothetical protein
MKLQSKRQYQEVLHLDAAVCGRIFQCGLLPMVENLLHSAPARSSQVPFVRLVWA